MKCRAMLLACLLAAGTAGCGSREASRPSAPVIVASIHPLGALAKEIAGPDAAVVVLLSPGASPHHFEPTPQVVTQGSRAALVVRVGVGLDDWAMPVVQEATDRGAPEIKATDFVHPLLPVVAHDEEAETADPHVWLDPVAMIPVCREIGEDLARIDPIHAAAYRARTAACIDSLEALDLELRTMLAPARGVPFVATHNAWSYLCRRYGLRQAEVMQEAATREPGPRRLVELVRGASRVGARAVFTEVQVSSASAQTLASELHLGVVLLDPQGTPSDPQRNRYFDLLRWNARRIASALAGAP